MGLQVEITGTQEERKTFSEVYNHYTLAREDLDQRITDFNKKDELFRSHIDKTKWPYRSLVFDPRTFTALYEKTARTFVNKPRGRMEPREGGDALGAKINNELLNFQWDDNERLDNLPMLAKWALMDLRTRRYGAAYGLVDWRWKQQLVMGKKTVYFDNPNFRPLDNRDCLANPSYSTIKNWFQFRDYVTIQDLESSNDAARGKPIYKNLHLLRDAMRKNAEKGGDRRDSNYVIKNKSLKGLQDYLGSDEVYRTIEIITEYRPDRWITFSPKHGVILRDIPNPYNHGQIPIIQLKYYPIDDDLYGLSEIEPVEKLQRALNAYICQNLDALNIATYTPLKINQTGGAVQMHTLQFGPGSKMLMNNPQTDVIPLEIKPAGAQEFPTIYRFMVGAIAEGYGEASAAASGLDPTASDKTATEIKESAGSRSVRDNFNKIFLEAALKKQMMFWYQMNQQFLFSNPNEKHKIIRIASKDAIRYFQEQGLDGEGYTDQSIETLSDPDLSESIMPSDLAEPIYPVDTPEGTIPKFVMENDGQTGSLVVEPEDLSGMYDYIPDVGSMMSNANEKEIEAKLQAVTLLQQPTVLQLLMQEQKKPKMSELLIDYFEDIGFKNADQYFETLKPDPMMMGGVAQNGVVQAGAVGPEAGAGGQANGEYGGMGAGSAPISNGAAQPVVSQPY